MGYVRGLLGSSQTATSPRVVYPPNYRSGMNYARDDYAGTSMLGDAEMASWLSSVVGRIPVVGKVLNIAGGEALGAAARGGRSIPVVGGLVDEGIHLGDKYGKYIALPTKGHQPHRNTAPPNALGGHVHHAVRRQGGGDGGDGGSGPSVPSWVLPAAGLGVLFLLMRR